MLLKNKKTGEIIEFDAILPVKDVVGDSVAHLEYGSLAELNEEWEDVPEEPKGYWFIDASGGVDFIALEDDTPEAIDGSKEIGNYFETREEARKAVKKLKAWKRLNNCGLKFIDWWLSKDNHIIIGTNRQIFDIDEQGLREDLDLLFGGEE